MVLGTKVIGLPPVKYVRKVPPIVPPSTWDVLGVNVMVVGLPEIVKESPPVAAKKPLMESARATAMVPKARTESMKRRFTMVVLLGGRNAVRENSHSDISRFRAT
jgi:hypothetical protein